MSAPGWPGPNPMSGVLLVRKTPLADRLTESERDRLTSGGVIGAERLAAPAAAHAACLDTVRAALAGLAVREIRVEDLRPEDADEADLIVTVGGDGTVFTANTLITTAPVLTVNSDPVTSVGHFTRATAATVATMVAAWRTGHHRLEAVPRLAVTAAGTTHFVLNDCLFSAINPAAMTKYQLEVPEGREFQRSSGVWVATAAGSTGAIRSAGGEPISRPGPALLFRVREPFLGRGPAYLLDGIQQPPHWLRLTSAVPGIALYLDGPNVTVNLQPGDVAEFAPAAVPLRLVTLPGY